VCHKETIVCHKETIVCDGVRYRKPSCAMWRCGDVAKARVPKGQHVPFDIGTIVCHMACDVATWRRGDVACDVAMRRCGVRYRQVAWRARLSFNFVEVEVRFP